MIFAGIQLQGPPKSVVDLQCPERSSSGGFPCEARTSAETIFSESVNFIPHNRGLSPSMLQSLKFSKMKTNHQRLVYCPRPTYFWVYCAKCQAIATKMLIMGRQDFPRLLQQASCSGAFYISPVSKERVDIVNNDYGLSLSVGPPIVVIGCGICHT